LSGIRVSLQRITKIAEIVSRQKALAHQLDASPLGSIALYLSDTPGKAKQALSAISWIRSVREIGLPSQVVMRLLCLRAGEERVHLRTVAAKGASIYTRHIKLLSQLRELGLSELTSLPPEELAKEADNLIHAATELPDYLPIRRYRAALLEAGLSEFLSKAEALSLAPQQFGYLLEAIVAARRVLPLFSDDVIKRNTGVTLDAHRRLFAQRDRKKIENDRRHIRKLLLSRSPLPGSRVGPRKAWTEMGLLHNEFMKQRGFAPVRSLLTRAGRSILALQPCFMMSPLSLAKFVPPGQLEFDVLVIDEASQMKPEDALGSMLRARQI